MAFSPHAVKFATTRSKMQVKTNRILIRKSAISNGMKLTGSKNGQRKPKMKNAGKTNGKGALHRGIMGSTKNLKHGRDAMKDYSIHHVPGRHLTFEDRLILARDWNRPLECARKPSLCKFATEHGLAPSTWLRDCGNQERAPTAGDVEFLVSPQNSGTECVNSL